MDGGSSILTLACVFILVLAIVHFGAMLCIEYYYTKQDEVARSAQKLELAPDVTLMRGLQCFFGRGSRWRVSKGLVYVESRFPDEDGEGGPAGEPAPALVLCVDPKAGRIEVVSCRLEGGYDAENLIDALIQAAASEQ